MLVSAVARVELNEMFHEVLATAGAIRWPVTQLTALIAPDVVPLPAQLSHFTPCRRTPLATPYDVEPMVPATCVPWLLQSVLVVSMALKSKLARPPKFGCVGSTPLSMM